ncbi:MAG: hypothetical protein NVSMB7_16470 [Chitinophagaceae bacterium]
MANKKKNSAAVSGHEPTLFEKIGGQAIHLKNEIVAGTDHLLEMAGEKIAAVTSSIKEYRDAKKKWTKAATTKRTDSQRAKKVAKKAGAKKPAKTKKTAEKSTKKKAKKKAAPKKAVPKKKAAPKKVAKRIPQKRSK